MSINLTEITRNLILDELKATIATNLAAVRTDRGDAAVTTEPPNSYFIYAPAAAYRCPAIFVLVDNVDFRVDQKGANFTSALVKIRLAVLVEDKDLNNLTIKAERYQAAVHESINEKTLLAPDLQVKIFVKVVRATFSEVYTPGRETAQGMFRKEIQFDLDVEHYERL